MATSDLLGRTGASDTCVTTQSGGECEGEKGSTSYSTRVCVSNHCWGQGLVLWASKVIENYWPLWQATWPCLPLGSWHVSLVQDSTAVAYPSTAWSQRWSEPNKRGQHSSAGRFMSLRSSNSFLETSSEATVHIFLMNATGNDAKKGLSCKNGKKMKLSGTVYAWASSFSVFSLVALNKLPVDNNLQISKLPSKCS